MEEVEKLTISDPILEQLRCFKCKGYLSCSPIQLLSNGKTICGRCSPSGDDGPTTKEFAFEATLRNILFPCKFKDIGCTKRLPFGQVNEHEQKCIYHQPFCPVSLSSYNTCSENEPWLQVTTHIIKYHSGYVKKNSGFQFEVGQHKEEIFMAENMGVSFMIGYWYNSTIKELQYIIQYLPSVRSLHEESYKIRLTNVSDSNFSCTLSGGKCVPFNRNFQDPKCTSSLDIADYLKILNDPETIEFEVDLAMDLILDCKLLESLKCKGCHGYLIPPIFDSDQGIICYDCFDDYSNCRSSTNEELKEVIANTNYPCRWYGCDFVDKSGNIRKHELECRFCVYQCPGYKPSTNPVFIENCSDSFKAAEAIAHFEGHLHKFHYFGDDEYKYEASIVKSNLDSKFSIFTLKYGRVVLIKGVSGWDQHTITVRVSDGYASPNGQKMHLHPIKCSLQFKHNHCDIKKVFIVSHLRSFTIKDFPDCFRPNEPLNVTLKLFQDIIGI